MADAYEMEREEESYAAMDRDATGWRSLWIVRWGRTSIIDPLMVILSRSGAQSTTFFFADWHVPFL